LKSLLENKKLKDNLKSSNAFFAHFNLENCEEDQVIEALVKRFEAPDECRVFEKGKFEILTVGGMTIGRATYQPGWQWSKHVAPLSGNPLCTVEHVGMVISGHAVAAMEDGTQLELKPGSLFYIPPVAHDSWVVGEETYVSLHFLGANHYTR